MKKPCRRRLQGMAATEHETKCKYFYKFKAGVILIFVLTQTWVLRLSHRIFLFILNRGLRFKTPDTKSPEDLLILLFHQTMSRSVLLLLEKYNETDRMHTSSTKSADGIPMYVCCLSLQKYDITLRC